MTSSTPPLSEPVDDATLVASLKAGDDHAFELMVRTYGGRMLAVARRMMPNEEDAHDAVQDAFLQAFRGIAGFAGGSKLSTWLHRIVVNAALMKLRARRSRPEIVVDDLMPHFAGDGHHAVMPDPWPRADEVLERRETREQVRRCIDRLPDNYRTVLLLRDIEQLNTEETAQAMGISVNAVKTRLHRARLALRTLLDPKFAERRA